MDTQTLEKIFGDFKPQRNEASNHQYALRLSKVAEEFNKDNDVITDDFLNEPEKVFDYLSTKKGRGGNPLPKSTHANILFSMIEYCQAKDRNILAMKYRKRKEQIDEAMFEQYNTGVLSDNQKAQYIPLKELIELVNKIDELCDCQEEHKSYLDAWSQQELRNVQLLFHLYLNYPSRNEYGVLQFIKWIDYRNLRRDAASNNEKLLKGNYVVVKSTGQMMLSISLYKTAHKYGIKETDITDPMCKKLLKERWVSFGKEGYLFTLPKTKGPWKRHTVVQALTRWSEKLVKKKISSTMIYKIIIEELGQEHKKLITDENYVKAEEVADLLSKYASIRGHSRPIQKKCYSMKAEEHDKE